MSTRIRCSAASKRRTQARQAAVAVLTGLATFATLQLGLAVGVETVLPKIRDPAYSYRLDHIHRRIGRDAPVKPFVVVMVGSSRTLKGFRSINDEKAWGEALGRPVAAYNFGTPGAGPLTELLTWERLRRDGVRPDLLLIEAMPPLLCAQVPPMDFREDVLPTDRLRWHDLPLIELYAGSIRPHLRRDWLQSWPAPWYTHRFSLVSLVRPDLLPPPNRMNVHEGMDESGAARPFETPAAQRPRALRRARVEYQPRLTGFQLGGPECEALCQLLASCRREGAPAALVLMPEGPIFRSWYPPEAWAAVQEWLERQSREYDAPLVNAREWIGEDDFVDSHHLLPHGAAQFTEQLGRKCILPLLRGEQLAHP